MSDELGSTTADTSPRVWFVVLTSIFSFGCIFMPWYGLIDSSSYKNFAHWLSIYGDHMSFEGGEIWEFWAVANSILATLFLQMASKGRGEVWTAIISGALSIWALGALGFHHLTIIGLRHGVAYGVLLTISVVGYTLSDFLLWAHGGLKKAEFVEIFYFVDVPVLIGFVMFFCRLPLAQRGHDGNFTGGAVTFQLILSNIILVLIRSRITEHPNYFGKLKTRLVSLEGKIGRALSII